jgi:very-short-patch-repair endonuclease
MGTVRRTISPHAAVLRREATDAEQLLWHRLRARQLGGHKFRRQWTIGPYIVDFCCLESFLVVEVDGGQHTPEADGARTNALQAEGFRIIRFWNNDVFENFEGVLLTILDALGGKKEEDPHPTLSRERERASNSCSPAPSPARGRRLG